MSNLKLCLGWGCIGNEELSDIYFVVVIYVYGFYMFGNILNMIVYEVRYVNSVF